MYVCVRERERERERVKEEKQIDRRRKEGGSQKGR